MPIGRPLAPLTLTDDERAKLTAWSRRPKSAQRPALRARIVLAADGRSNTVVAADLRVTLPTVGKWRSRFRAKRLDGLTDEPRPGPARTITDAHVEAVVTKTLESKPANATHWSTRGMAQATGLSQTAISRIWSGERSASNPTGPTRSSCRSIRTSSRRSGTWSGCTSTRRTGSSS